MDYGDAGMGMVALHVNGDACSSLILREVTKHVTPPRRQWARDSGGVRQYETELLAAGPGEDRIL